MNNITCDYFVFHLENVGECCKVQWVCVHQRIMLYKSYLLLLLCVRRGFYMISHCFISHDFTVCLKMSREKKWTSRWVSKWTDLQRSKQAHEKASEFVKGELKENFVSGPLSPQKTHTPKKREKNYQQQKTAHCLALQLFCVKWPPPPFPGPLRVRRGLLQQLEVGVAVGWR